MLTKEFEGERKMLITRIEALEKTGKEQSERIQNLTQQLEKAYQKVQDIAVKAVEGSANARSFSTFQQMVKEQSRGKGRINSRLALEKYMEDLIQVEVIEKKIFLL